MATKKQTGAFLIALMEMPETVAAIARDVWGWVAALWQNHVAARPILWFLIVYVCVIATVIGWRYVEGSAFLTWEFWEGVTPQAGNAQDARNLTGGPEGIRNLIWSLATLFGGAAAVTGIILAARRTKAANHQADAALKQSETAFQSLVTERFTKAVEQLGHEKRAVRLGAIYALERIAKDSPRDRDVIVETLAAYIRELAPWPPRDKETGQSLAGDALEAEARRIDMRPPIDIAAALTVLCGLLPDDDATRQKVGLRHTDLRGLDAPRIDLGQMRLDQANLSRANLSWANLSGANLFEADLSEASLSGANVFGADLNGAKLSRAKLSGANLSRAYLSRADLSGAKLHHANVFGAKLSEASLFGADLSRAKLSGAKLSGANLSGANLFEADLSEASLSGANVFGADLSGANLSGARLTQEQINGIRYFRGDPPKNLPEGLDPAGTL